MADPDDDLFARDRVAMVEQQLIRRGVRDERVLDAMSTVRRERFLTEQSRDRAYDDVALPIASGQSISQPYMVARMTELLAVEPGDRILEVGTGSGYQAAILAALGAQVVTIERLPGLAEQARALLAALGLGRQVAVIVGDGSVGIPGGAFDGILVTAGAPDIPSSLPEQLADGGRLVIPVGPRDLQRLVVLTREGDTWTERSVGECVFVPLVGAAGWAT